MSVTFFYLLSRNQFLLRIRGSIDDKDRVRIGERLQLDVRNDDYYTRLSTRRLECTLKDAPMPTTFAIFTWARMPNSVVCHFV